MSANGLDNSSQVKNTKKTKRLRFKGMFGRLDRT